MSERKLRINNSGYIDTENRRGCKIRAFNAQKKLMTIAAPKVYYADGKVVTDAGEVEDMEREQERLKRDAIRFNKRDRLMTISMPKITDKII